MKIFTRIDDLKRDCKCYVLPSLGSLAVVFSNFSNLVILLILCVASSFLIFLSLKFVENG